MKKITRLKVALLFDKNPIKVGEMVADGKNIFFKYNGNFINKGLQIAPFKLPLSKNILGPETSIFEGLFGVFNDSLPDGWGRLLMDRHFNAKGFNLNNISPLDRLAYIGKNGTGALIYEPIQSPNFEVNNQIDLDYIFNESQLILDGKPSDIIETLFNLGGSSGGARPKIQVGYSSKQKHFIYGKETLPEGYEHWLIKFPASNDLQDIAQIEYAYYKMAIAAKIDMSSSRLFSSASGRKYFGTKRFDRIENRRIHLQSAAALLHDNFRLSSLDYGHLMDATFQLEKNVAAYSKILRLACFNVFAHNRDDHSKNVSFLMNHKGTWSLAPAYDLTYSLSSHGQHSTTIAGEGLSPKRKHLLELAAVFKIKNPEIIIDEVAQVVKNWNKYALEAGVTKNSIKIINQALQV